MEYGTAPGTGGAYIAEMWKKNTVIKRGVHILLWAVLLCIVFTGCGKTEAPTEGSTPPGGSASPGDSTMHGDNITPGGSGSSVPLGSSAESGGGEHTPQDNTEDTMYIIIGEHTLTVKMADNSSARALLALLGKGDITVDAHDYGSFEKVGSLGTKLPTNDERITTEPGDVILYQDDQITLYYDTNSWSFTRLGKVQGVTAEELRSILGDGDVKMVLKKSIEGGKKG